jgi:hypothetical protein
MTGSEIAPVITSIATLLGVVINGFISARNGRKLTVVHNAVNGKMEELVKVVEAASFAKGVKAEKEKDGSSDPVL